MATFETARARTDEEFTFEALRTGAGPKAAKKPSRPRGTKLASLSGKIDKASDKTCYKKKTTGCRKI